MRLAIWMRRLVDGGKRLVGALLCSAAFLGAAAAQQAAEGSDFTEATQRWLDVAVAQSQSTNPLPLRMEVSVGSLDSRLRLAPCAKVEPYLPPGTRLWGRTRLGLRCADGVARWNVFLPITIKAFGPAWVLKSNVAPGAAIGPEDAMEAEVDWADELSPIVAEQNQWTGQIATRALMAGQALRQSMVRAPQVFQAGAQIRVVAQGPGFMVASDGQAVSAGVVGQIARVRMDNGRVMSGTVLDTRTVKVDL